MQIEPRGARREDVRLAILRSDVRGPHMDRPEDANTLLPKFRPEPPLDPEVEEAVNDFFTLDEMPSA